jgi:1D-myo-inositol-tetrakisphosphate 5-kinase/inositol-polyphosphate multikinase
MDVGLPSTLLLPILRFIRKSVQELRDVLSSIDLRLIGSSLLIVYEGDWERAELGVEWLDKHLESTSNDEERKEEEMDEDGEGSGEDVEGSEEGAEEGSEDEDWDSLCPCVVRLIDFAHTRLRPGQGPEPGVLKGLDGVLGLLDGRIAAL